MEKLVLDYIIQNKLIEKNDKILVAVSGGPDSMCLLNILYNLKETLKIELYVAHVNHMIRTDAKDDANYVEKICESKNIKFFLKECDVAKKSKQEKISIEEAGRNARYEFFKGIANKNNINKIAIAHNKNDLAETLIMNILRGTGTQGLKSINNKNDIYIRPLLNISREEIEEYCQKNNIEPRIDSTNFENTYTRNKIRNIVIPYIKQEFNPNIIDTLVRLSQIATEEQNFIDLEVEKYYKKILIGETKRGTKKEVKKETSIERKVDTKEEAKASISISGKEFTKLNIAIKKRIILYIIKKLFKTTQKIEKKHIEDIIKLIDNNIGNKYLMPNKDLKISIKRGIVEFSRV